MTANNAGNKSKNTTFKMLDIFFEEIINFLLGPDTVVLRFQGHFFADHGHVFAFDAHHGKSDLVLVQHMAVADCPYVSRAKVRPRAKALELVHQVFTSLAQLHFLLQVREPNQKPMMAPSIDISSALKMTSA